MPNFGVIVANKAKKGLNEFDEKTKRKIVEALFELEFEPVPAKKYNMDKVANTTCTYRIRIQFVRIVYDVFWDDKRIEVLKIERKKDRTYK